MQYINILKELVKRNYWLWKVFHSIKSCCHRQDKVCIDNKGLARIKKHIRGKNNSIFIGEGSILDTVHIRIVGNNNKIVFGENVIVRKNCSFWMEGNNIEILIGNNTTFNHSNHFCAQENNSKIIIGSDCMFANHIIARTSDSHPIFDKNTHKRINYAKNIYIDDHVWIAAQVTIMKGVHIGTGSVVGFGSIVTKDISPNTIAVGTPAKEVKKDICWRHQFIESIKNESV